MKKTIIASVAAAALLGVSGIAHAGMGIPNLPAQPITAQTPPGVIGQAYPSFTGPSQPVVNVPFAHKVVGNSGNE